MYLENKRGVNKMKYTFLWLILWITCTACPISGAFEPCYLEEDETWYRHGSVVKMGNQEYICKHGKWVVNE